MLRNNSLPDNRESDDQSISDEDEEVDSLWRENFVSLAGTSDRKKKGMGISSQLELLEGVHQNNVGFFSDDEVEAPDFDEKTYLDSPSREVSHSVGLERDAPTYKRDNQLTNDEGSRLPVNSVVARCTVSELLDRYARGKQIQSEPYMWSAADDGRRPVDKCITMGCGPMGRKESSSDCQEQKIEKFWSSVLECKGHNSSSFDDLPDEYETGDYRRRDLSISEHLGCPDIKQISVSNLASPVETDVQHERSRHSMVELLYELQGKRRNSQFKCNTDDRSKGKMGQHTVVRSVSSSWKDVMSDDEASDVMDSGSSTDNEGKAEAPEQAIVESKGKTMAEKFQEAIGSSVAEGRASFTVLDKSSSGVFARLQIVLQRQKERDTEYLKNLQIDIWPKGEARCLDVKIMSRSYDAKLIVCQCSLLENEESSLGNPQGEKFGKIWSIIFSPRVCGDVDLEVASLIRIHPPWKEVQVHGGEVIILATYYSQIYT